MIKNIINTLKLVLILWDFNAFCFPNGSIFFKYLSDDPYDSLSECILYSACNSMHSSSLFDIYDNDCNNSSLILTSESEVSLLLYLHLFIIFLILLDIFYVMYDIMNYYKKYIKYKIKYANLRKIQFGGSYSGNIIIYDTYGNEHINVSKYAKDDEMEEMDEMDDDMIYSLDNIQSMIIDKLKTDSDLSLGMDDIIIYERKGNYCYQPIIMNSDSFNMKLLNNDDCSFCYKIAGNKQILTPVKMKTGFEVDIKIDDTQKIKTIKTVNADGKDEYIQTRQLEGVSESGTFVDGKLVKGSKTYPNIYENGEYSNNLLVKGTRMTGGNYIEEGIFRDGIFIEGVKHYPSGEGFYHAIGTFDENGHIKNGTENYNGVITQGEFEDGELIEGKIELANGNIYEGFFRDHVLVEGKIISKNMLMDGFFIDGKLSKGRREHMDTIYEGTFENNVLKNGILINKYFESVEEGEFDDGELIKGTKISVRSGKEFCEYGKFDKETGKLIDGTKIKIKNILHETLFKFVDVATIYEGTFDKDTRKMISGTETQLEDTLKNILEQREISVPNKETFKDGFESIF